MARVHDLKKTRGVAISHGRVLFPTVTHLVKNIQNGFPVSILQSLSVVVTVALIYLIFTRMPSDKWLVKVLHGPDTLLNWYLRWGRRAGSLNKWSRRSPGWNADDGSGWVGEITSRGIGTSPRRMSPYVWAWSSDDGYDRVAIWSNFFMDLKSMKPTAQGVVGRPHETRLTPSIDDTTLDWNSSVTTQAQSHS